MEHKIFICDCKTSTHHLYAYIDDEFDFCDFVMVAEKPYRSFWEKIKLLFSNREIVVSDLVLRKEQLKELGETLIEMSSKS
jgi:hypothetical protein